MSASALLRKLDATGWTTMILGGLCVAVAALEVAAPRLLAALAALAGPGDDPTRATREAMERGSVAAASVNLAFGVALIVIGAAIVRRRRWAHPALTLASWGSIVALAVLARPTLAPLIVMSGGGTIARYAAFGAGVFLLVAQVAAVLWFLRFWARPEVKAAFR